MIEWEIKREPWAEPEWQEAYGDAATIEVTGGEGGISVAEVIDTVGLRFTIAHALECVKQGVWKPDADGIVLAGEIPCWAKSIAEQAARKRKVRA